MPLKPHPTDPDKMVYESHQYDLPKPWVGLTQEQRQQLWTASGNIAGFGGISFKDIDRIEAMLKENNT